MVICFAAVKCIARSIYGSYYAVYKNKKKQKQRQPPQIIHYNKKKLCFTVCMVKCRK